MKPLLPLLLLAGACSDPGPCRSTALTKGPWVMRADGQGASVFWETKDAPACVAIGLTPEGGGDEKIVMGTSTATMVSSSYGTDTGLPMPDVSGTFYLSRVDARGLPAGSCFAYRVRSTGDDVRGRFCTARPSGQPFTFFAIGDTDPILGHTTGTLAATMPSRPDFTTHMGDIQYYSAIGETWAYWFGPMAPMLRAGAFFPAVGNHENELNGAEYVDYYDRLFHQPSLDGTPKWYRFEWGGVWFHTIDTEEPFDSGSEQYGWLTSSLKEVSAKPDYRFSVVYMHRNLYTLGDAAPQVDQRQHLSPIFVANKVRLVLSGHMHGYERFETPGDITYVTTGGGGGQINDVNKNVPLYPADVPYRVAAAAKYHGMLFDVTPMSAGTRLHGRAIDENGVVFDEFSHDIP